MRLSPIVLALLVFTLSPGWILAQAVLPVFDSQEEGGQAQKATFQDAKKAGDFRHGTHLRVTLNDDSKVEGTLVRVDRKAARIFVRTEPGAAPKAISQKEIKSVEKAVRDGQNVVTPEIRQVDVYSGPARSVRYSAGASLTAEERRGLQELEDAENEFGRLDALHARRGDVIDTEMAIQSERFTTNHLINELLRHQVNSEFWVLPLAPSFHHVLIQHDQPELAKMVAALPPFEAWSKARDNVRDLRSRIVVEDGQVVAVIVAEK